MYIILKKPTLHSKKNLYMRMRAFFGLNSKKGFASTQRRILLHMTTCNDVMKRGKKVMITGGTVASTVTI